MGSRQTFLRYVVWAFNGNASKSYGHFLETLKCLVDFSWKYEIDACDFVDAVCIGCKCIFGCLEKPRKARKSEEKPGKGRFRFLTKIVQQ